MKRLLLLIIPTVVALAACRPEPDDAKLFDEFVVATNYDPNAVFSSYITYAIPTDTIGFISNSSNDTIITGSYPEHVLSEVRAQIESLGYTRVDRSENPDIGVNVLVVNDFNVFQDVYYPYYDPGFYGGYWGYGSWYYYPYVQTYAYNTGVLIIEMVDLKNRTANNQVRVIWDAYMGDVYSTIDRMRQTTEGINEAFSQSPYLGR